ncbi:MAG: hypothetical protein HYX55_02730 [Chloroflexi bacterium]|nr:hypothetical protein [Chloroflexota bacterium]
MIVVGILAPPASPRAADPVVEIARRAAATGARTEVVGVAPDGALGDRQLVQLAAAGVGHATVTRSAAPGVEPADLELALRYLPDVRVIALVAPASALLSTARAASAWSGASLVVVGPLDADGLAAIDAASVAPASDAPILLEPPAHDPDGAFAGLVAALAVRLDAGEDPALAWRSTLATLAIDPA